MTKATILLYIIVQCYFSTKLIVFGNDAGVFVANLDETLVEEYQHLNNTNILRYGHHRTQDCEDFKKSYVCIMKCLELGYQIAHSNKKCVCTCYKNPTKAKYFSPVSKGWKVPTTSLPSWAVVNNSNNNFVKIDSDDDIIKSFNDNNSNSTEKNTTDNNIENTTNVENPNVTSNTTVIEDSTSQDSLNLTTTDSVVTDGEPNGIDPTDTDPVGDTTNRHPTEENPTEENPIEENPTVDNKVSSEVTTTVQE